MTSNEAIKIAYEKGYRVDEKGVLKNPKGKVVNGFVIGYYLNFAIRVSSVVKNMSIHRFAAYCFYGEELFNSECVRHLNGIKTDNSKNNIMIGSLSENYNDNSNQWKIEFARKGAKTKRKLSEIQVLEIKNLLKNNEKVSVIAKKFGVAKTTIVQIREGKSYSYVR